MERNDRPEQIQAAEQQKSPEQIWSGNNLKLVSNTIFPAGGTVRVQARCSVSDFPDSTLFTQEEIAKKLSFSMRSRYAQLGLTPSPKGIPRLIRSYYRARLKGHVSFTATVPIQNLSGAAIGITEETGLMRLYMQPEEFVRNGDLKSLMGQENGIQVEGIEGVDWKYYREPNKNGISEETGIMLRIRDEGRGYIPAQKGRGTKTKRSNAIFLSESDTDDHYRAQVKRVLEPVEGRKNPFSPCLWIGDTPHVALGEGITAIIDRNVFATSLGKTPNSTPALHIDSRLIDSGSAWPVRVEVYGPTDMKHKANWVVFRIHHQATKAA